MTNLTNQDNKNNFYFGYRTNNFAYAPGSEGVTSQQLTDWINDAFGQTCAIRLNDDQINLILPVAFESLSLPVTVSKTRFQKNGDTICSANTDSDLATFNRVNRNFGFSFSDSLALNVTYAVLNNKSLNVFQIRRTGANLDSSTYQFLSVGWLSDSLYSGGAFPRSAYSLVLSSVSGNDAFRASLENTNVIQSFAIPASLSADSIANYSLSCQIATPGANATEFYLRDFDAPNKAIGYIPNVLKTSLDIPIGQIYRNSGIDPDGSDNLHWISVGSIGNEYLLMRVWATGLV
jgi:hypothetical protein